MASELIYLAICVGILTAAVAIGVILIQGEIDALKDEINFLKKQKLNKYSNKPKKFLDGSINYSSKEFKLGKEGYTYRGARHLMHTYPEIISKILEYLDVDLTLDSTDCTTEYGKLVKRTVKRATRSKKKARK